MIRLFIIICFCFIQISVFGQYKESTQIDTSKVNYKELALVGTIIPVTMTGVYIYLNNVWWSDKRVPFHITDDLELRYALNLDKAGHFISSYFVSTVFSDVLEVTGFNKKQAVWGGAALSIINSGIVEIKDGYSPYWGFSKFDMLANTCGALLPVLQYKYPFFQNIHFNWSYDFSHPSYYSSLPGREDASFIDDYERQNFWITFDAARAFFPDKDHSKFPYFLDPAFGMSAQNLDGKGSGQYEWFLGVDINLSKLKFVDKPFEKVATKYLRFYHWPAPALRLYPQVTAYPITY